LPGEQEVLRVSSPRPGTLQCQVYPFQQPHSLQPKRTVQQRKRRADSFPLGVVLPRDCEIAVGVKIITVLGVDLAQLFDKCRKAICPSKHVENKC